MGAGWNRARQAAIVQGVELLELHHPRKPGGQDSAARAPELADLYGSRWIPAGIGSAVVLHGQAGDPIVKLYHRKPAVSVLGPWDVLFSRDGEVSLHGKPDLVQLVRYSRDGVTAKDASMLLYDTEKPSASETEKARRHLKGLVRTGVAVKKEGKEGGGAKAAPARWFLRGPEHPTR